MKIKKTHLKQRLTGCIRNGVLAAALLMPFSVSAAPVAFAMGGQSLSSFYLFGMELGPWEDYLLKELTPDLAVLEVIQTPKINWLANDAEKMLPAFARRLLENDKAKIMSTFSYTASFQNTLTHGLNFKTKPMDASITGLGLERELVSSGFVQQFGDSSILAVSALMAHQRFGTSALGVYRSEDIGPGNSQSSWESSPWAESSYGAGVWMGLESYISKKLAVNAGFQSRIDMDDFDNYRGVYSEPGDLDIPARAHFGMTLMATDNHWFSAGIDRVLYSSLATSPSNFLPERFISLLGDSSSPQFNWADLTVYSISWRWKDNNQRTEWWVDLSTRQQPSPTSSALNNALRSQYSGNVMQLGFSTQTGERSKLNLRAAYAPPEYVFGGSVLGIVPDNLEQKIEMEALWVLSF
ncbi:MAG: hypothetical protein L3J22_10540 [Xanthomonadales bacterium]|nr:hypothetical protein [Xanthomonadales bacterium]